MMASFKDTFVPLFFRYLPSVLVCVTFFPCGLISGYTLTVLTFEKKHMDGSLIYAPLILGTVIGLITALVFIVIKTIKRKIVYCHFYFLMGAAVCNLISSGFYFTTRFQSVGSNISYFSHSMTFVAGLSYLHSVPDKNTRAIFISTCFCLYLAGMSSAISSIIEKYNENIYKYPYGPVEEILRGVYNHFAVFYLSISIIILGLLVGLHFLNVIGTVDCNNSIDEELREANTNEIIFENRSEIIQRIQFFYVTKCQRWRITLVMLITETIQYGQFIYFVYWFAMNTEIRLTSLRHCDVMLWTVFAGAAVSTFALAFLSPAFQYAVIQIFLIVIATISIIVAAITGSKLTLWILVFLFGMAYSHLTIILIEVTHFRLTELLIFISYFTKLAIIGIIFYVFVVDKSNLYFYSTDVSTLMTQGFIFMVITCLLGLIVAVKAPNTHRKSLFHIQYDLLGIIFLKHQIEELNVNWLNDGTIPTVNK